LRVSCEASAKQPLHQEKYRREKERRSIFGGVGFGNEKNGCTLFFLLGDAENEPLKGALGVCCNFTVEFQNSTKARECFFLWCGREMQQKNAKAQFL
jgi:hypothetical protein